MIIPSLDYSILQLLSILDWVVFISALAFTFFAALYAHKAKKKIKNKNNILIEYLLMGRQLSLPFFVTTLVATWYGGIFGVTQIAFENGIYNFFTQGLFWYISYIFFAFLITKKIFVSQATTLPDLIKKLYGKNSAILSAVFIFIKTLPITYLIGVGLFIQMIYPMPMPIATAIGAVIVVSYCFFGGLRAIILSDFVQFFFMLLSVILVLVFSVINFGGIGFLQESLPSSYFKISSNYSLLDTALWLFLAMSSTFINPAFYQRCLAAKSEKTAFYGILIATIIWCCFDLCTTLGAMYAKAIIPDANSTTAYLNYSLQLLPSGLRGFLLAGILATILSTLDSFLFLASNIIFYDLKLLNKIKNFNRRHILAIVLTAVITWVSSKCFTGNFENFYKMIKGFFASSLLLPILLGYFKPKIISDRQMAITIVISAISSFIWRACFYEKTSIDSFYIGILVSFICLFINFMFSKLFYLQGRRSYEVIGQEN